MSDLECPYCEHLFDDYDPSNNGDGYRQDCNYEFECPKCEKVFMASIDYRISYSEFKTPCLNDGGKHVMKKVRRYPMVIFGEVQIRCQWCDKKEDIPWEKGIQYGYDREEMLEDMERFNRA